MKFSVINASLKEGPVQGNDVLPVERFICTIIKTFIQHYIFSRNNAAGELYTFVVEIVVTPPYCKTNVHVTKFNKELGSDDSYRTYSGGKPLSWNIDVEKDKIYYLQDLAAAALNHAIATSMKDFW